MVHSGGALCDSAKDAFIGMEEGIRPTSRHRNWPLINALLFTQSLCDFALAHNHPSLEFEFASAGYAGTTVSNRASVHVQ